MLRNEKAIKILEEIHWTSMGWKEKREVSERQKLELIELGYWKEGVFLTHDECVQWAFEEVNKTSKEEISNAFLYSLSSRHLEYRSAIGSFSHIHLMPSHSFKRTDQLKSDYCRVCGYTPWGGLPIDFCVMNFERHKWGGVRHGYMDYMAYDLSEFNKLEKVFHTKADEAILIDVLRIAKTSPSVTYMAKGLGKIIKSNNSERTTLCQILGYAGILQPDDCPSFFNQHVNFDQRGDGRPRSDQNYPLGWWRGNGFRMDAVQYWFPQIADKI